MGNRCHGEATADRSAKSHADRNTLTDRLVGGKPAHDLPQRQRDGRKESIVRNMAVRHLVFSRNQPRPRFRRCWRQQAVKVSETIQVRVNRCAQTSLEPIPDIIRRRTTGRIVELDSLRYPPIAILGQHYLESQEAGIHGPLTTAGAHAITHCGRTRRPPAEGRGRRSGLRIPPGSPGRAAAGGGTARPGRPRSPSARRSSRTSARPRESE